MKALGGTARRHGRLEGADLQGHVVRAGRQQAAGGIPLDGVDLVLERGRRWLDEQKSCSCLRNLNFSYKKNFIESPAGYRKVDFLTQTAAS